MKGIGDFPVTREGACGGAFALYVFGDGERVAEMDVPPHVLRAWEEFLEAPRLAAWQDTSMPKPDPDRTVQFATERHSDDDPLGVEWNPDLAAATPDTMLRRANEVSERVGVYLMETRPWSEGFGEMRPLIPDRHIRAAAYELAQYVKHLVGLIPANRLSKGAKRVALFRNKKTGLPVMAAVFLGAIDAEIRKILGDAKNWRHDPATDSIDLGHGTRQEGEQPTEAETLRRHDWVVRGQDDETAVAMSPEEFAADHVSAAQDNDEPLTAAEVTGDGSSSSSTGTPPPPGASSSSSSSGPDDGLKQTAPAKAGNTPDAAGPGTGEDAKAS